MKIIKILLAIVAVIIIALGVLVYVGLGKIDGFVEEIIESTGTKTLQTQVLVDGVSIGLTEGKGVITGLTVANPVGFSGAKILSVGDVGLQLDIESLTKPVKVIKEVYITGVNLKAEHKNITDTNIEALLDNLKKSSSSASGSSQSSSSDVDIRLAIEKLRVGEIGIDLSSEKYGSRSLTVPAYTQTGIGSKTNGLTPDQISQAIVNSILQRSKTAVTNELKAQAKDKIGDKAKEKLKESLSTDKLKSLFK